MMAAIAAVLALAASTEAQVLVGTQDDFAAGLLSIDKPTQKTSDLEFIFPVRKSTMSSVWLCY